MFAVLKTGGKQYRVAEGDVLRVEKLACEAGEKVQFNDVLMIGGDEVRVGSPRVDGAAVQADVIDQIRGEKLIHFVKRRRKHGSQRTKGHRQYLTLLRVTDILASGAESSGVKAAVGAGSMPRTARDSAADAVKAAPAKARTASKAAVGKASDLADDAVAAVEEANDSTSTVTKAAVAGAAAVGAAAMVGAAVAASSSGEEVGTRPSNLMDEARDGKPDDLKKISGVGPKLESNLHEHGVFHFDQIAAWGPDEIAYMDETLSFKGRIERDGWIEQAKRFAAEQE
ncbi:50S ribosomal protein L21 [uncultured Jannaschia sp.]|uniref:50S ribosomal protein L21 n=1 Tax=uncultured Jannaschia sp. TaxID=293347 RepID=UPI00262EBD4A|nr:50S ribosomal protein L21 [uncultured Jannaschia sp.]